MVKNIFIRFFEYIGAQVLEKLEGIGSFTKHFLDISYWTFKRPYRIKLFLDQFYFIGNKSLFIIALTSVFSGMVITYQTYIGMKVMGAYTLVGPIVVLTIAKELAPVFSAIIVTGRCGAAMAAEIGTMKVTEQIDALEVMGISSRQYLGVPRVWATMLALPLLNLVFLFVANIGSWFVGVEVLGIEEAKYYSKLKSFVSVSVLFEGLIKAAVFGYIIGLIGTFHGFKVQGGAEGVGKGTNAAVVWGMIVILILDYFLTSILVKVLYEYGV